MMTGRTLLLATLVTAMAALPVSARPMGRDYPGCDLAQQHRLRAPTGGNIRDPRQAHVAMRTNILEADIGNARKARRLSQAEAQALWHDVEQVRRDADRFVARQGFLSAGETASHDRALDRVAAKLCR